MDGILHTINDIITKHELTKQEFAVMDYLKDMVKPAHQIQVAGRVYETDVENIQREEEGKIDETK